MLNDDIKLEKSKGIMTGIPNAFFQAHSIDLNKYASSKARMK